MTMTTEQQVERIIERVSILLDRGESEAKATKEYKKMIFFRGLTLKNLAGYLTKEKMLGLGTVEQQLDKLALLGFEENRFGTALVVDWEETRYQRPHHLFYLRALWLSSSEYAAFESRHSKDDFVMKFCNARFNESPVDEYEHPLERSKLLGRLTLNAIARTLHHFQDDIAEWFEESFDDGRLKAINVPSLLDEFIDNLEQAVCVP